MATYRAELRQSFDVAPDDDCQKYFTDLGADPTTTNGVTATTPYGNVTVPFSNVLAVIEVTS